MVDPGQIVILNGAPRSGKSSIVTALQDGPGEPWMNLGVDVFARQVTPERLRPGLGLRPGGERPAIEARLPALYAAMYDSVAAHSRRGMQVVVDVGHHDGYSRPLGLLSRAASQLDGLPALLVGVRCPLAVIMARRDAGQPGREGEYATTTPEGDAPEAVRRWQEAVHDPGLYDLEVDTAQVLPHEAAERIRRHLRHGPPPAALRQLATLRGRSDL